MNNTPRAFSSTSRRTRLITAAAVAAVAIAGAFAVSANIGILNRTQKNPVGTLASADLTSSVPQSVNVRLNPSSSSSIPAADTQEFEVDVAGTVAIASNNGSLLLVKATPTTGWSWTLSQSNSTSLKVTFTNGVRTVEFNGTTKADGSVDAAVTEPITTPAPAGTSQSGGREDDDEDHSDYEGGGDDD